MLRYSFILLTLSLAMTTVAQTSVADGQWIDGATWGGTSPGYTGLGTLTVDSHVTSDEGLSFSGNNKTLTVSDTLVVYGNVLFDATSGAEIVVGPENVLIIFGDLDMGRNHAGIDIGLGGMVIVTGDVIAAPRGRGGAIGDVTGDGTLYTMDGSSTTGFNVDNAGGEMPIDQIAETEGPDKQSIEDFVLGGGVTPLPVEFLFFKAEVGAYVTLSWATASELDNDRFEVERSDDGHSFYTIGEEQGNGTTNERMDYAYADHAAMQGEAYYRLRQVDFDGQFEYSETIHVGGLKDATLNFTVFPTMVTANSVNISANGAFEVDEIQLISLSGSNQSVHLSFARISETEISAMGSNLTQGIYLMKMNTVAGHQLVERIVVR